MRLATAMTTAVGLLLMAAAAPTGLAVLHSDAAEQKLQEQMLDRLGSVEPGPERPQRHATPPSAADDKRAAAWRADHLTCISRKGRTAAQYEAECRAWLNSREEH